MSDELQRRDFVKQAALSGAMAAGLAITEGGSEALANALPRVLLSSEHDRRLWALGGEYRRRCACPAVVFAIAVQ